MVEGVWIDPFKPCDEMKRPEAKGCGALLMNSSENMHACSKCSTTQAVMLKCVTDHNAKAENGDAEKRTP